MFNSVTERQLGALAGFTVLASTIPIVTTVLMSAWIQPGKVLLVASAPAAVIGLLGLSITYLAGPSAEERRTSESSTSPD